MESKSPVCEADAQTTIDYLINNLQDLTCFIFIQDSS